MKVSITLSFSDPGYIGKPYWAEKNTLINIAKDVHPLAELGCEKEPTPVEPSAHHMTELEQWRRIYDLAGNDPDEVKRIANQEIKKAASFPIKEFKHEVETFQQQKSGLAPEKFKTFSVPLPEAVYDNVCEAEKKLARALDIDIETKPGSRILVWEALAHVRNPSRMLRPCRLTSRQPWAPESPPS